MFFWNLNIFNSTFGGFNDSFLFKLYLILTFLKAIATQSVAEFSTLGRKSNKSYNPMLKKFYSCQPFKFHFFSFYLKLVKIVLSLHLQLEKLEAYFKKMWNYFIKAVAGLDIILIFCFLKKLTIFFQNDQDDNSLSSQLFDELLSQSSTVDQDTKKVSFAISNISISVSKVHNKKD